MTTRALIIDLSSKPSPEFCRLTANNTGIAEFITVDREQQALHLLHEGTIDLIFFPWNAATSQQGLELLRKLRKREEWEDIPFLLCTDTSTGAVARAFDAGANDCLLLSGPEAENLARIQIGRAHV